MFLRTVARPPRADEAATLHSLFEAERRRFADDPEATRSWLGAPADAIETATAERAAWTSVAQAILNLDEFLSRG
jgi:hypothetical protein